MEDCIVTLQLLWQTSFWYFHTFACFALWPECFSLVLKGVFEHSMHSRLSAAPTEITPSCECWTAIRTKAGIITGNFIRLVVFISGMNITYWNLIQLGKYVVSLYHKSPERILYSPNISLFHSYHFVLNTHFNYGCTWGRVLINIQCVDSATVNHRLQP